MKLLILLSIVAYGYGDKLDRTYLPPPSAGTAGGSPGALTAPGPSSGANGPLGQQGFGQNVQGIRPSGPSGNSQPSPLYGPASGRQPAIPSAFGQTNTELSATGFIPNRPSFPQQPQSTSSGANINAGFGPSGGHNAPSNTFGQSPSSNAFEEHNQQHIASGFPQQGTGFSQGQGTIGFSPQPYTPERAQAARDKSAEILKYTNENDGNRFSYSFETSNGISAEESGVATDGVKAQGGFSYTGDDGKAYTVTYTADENGYQPQGEHLPTPHPIPEEILKSLEKNAQAAAAGTQEGAYRPEEYENEDSAQGYTSGPSNRPQLIQGQGPSQQYGTPTAIGRPTSGVFDYQSQGNQQVGPQNHRKTGPQNYQQTGHQNQGVEQNAPTGPSGQYNKPSLTDALNQALNQPTGSSGLIGQSNVAPQNIASYTKGQAGQIQDASGYKYNRPQNNQYSSGSISQGSSSSSPQLNIQPISPGTGIPVSSGQPTASNGFSSSSGQSFQHPSGPNQAQGQTFGPTNPSRPTSGQTNQYQPESNQNQYQTGSSSQGYNYQAPSTSRDHYQRGSGQNLNRPSAGNQDQYQPGSGQSSNRPAFSQQSGPTNQFQPGATNVAQNQPRPERYQPNSPTGSTAGFTGQGSQNQPDSHSPQPQYPGSNQSRYQPGQNRGPASGAKEAVQAPYQYNRPAQTLNPHQRQGPQTGSNKPSLGSQTVEQFGGPRQPPSFNPQDGYTY